MNDITNNLDNLGRPLEDRRVVILFTIEELRHVIALAQNPHESYQDNSKLMKVAEEFFELGTEAVGYHERRFLMDTEVKKPPVLDVDDPLSL